MQRGGGTDASVEAAFTRLSAQLKNRQFKKALKSIEESEHGDRSLIWHSSSHSAED